MKTLCFALLFWIPLLGFAQNNVEVSNAAIFEGEPYLTHNPLNPQHLVAAWMGYQWNQKIVIKSAVSFNGGTSWTQPVSQTHLIPSYSSADVSLGFDHLGNAFMCYIDYDNVTFSSGKVLLRKSTDGGLTWGNPTEVISISDCPGKLCIDRPWMVIDHFGANPTDAIYVCTMNADQPALVSAPYNPYLSVSTDGGVSFNNPRFMDTLQFLAGTTIPQPSATPAIGGDGTYWAIYPSYDVSQSPFPRHILVQTQDAGINLQHSIAYQGTLMGVSNGLFKRGGKLAADPAHSGHLAYLFLSQQNDQSDVYYIETFNGGAQWSAMQKINQDPAGIPRVQDLVWADFNEQGDLLACWRDRRNAGADGYNQPSEIYAATKNFGGAGFEQDYPITSQSVAHDTILEGKGNDFMSAVFIGDTAYAVWGDVRTGTVRIYLNKWNVNTQVGQSHLMSSETQMLISPNPVHDGFKIPEKLLGYEVKIYNTQGEVVWKTDSATEQEINLSSFPMGGYLFLASEGNVCFKATFIKE